MITLYMVNVCLTVYVIEEQSQSVAADLLACMSVFVCVYKYVCVTDCLYSVWRLFYRLYICLYVPICPDDIH